MWLSLSIVLSPYNSQGLFPTIDATFDAFNQPWNVFLGPFNHFEHPSYITHVATISR
jgi:hypothetical protein